MRKYACCYATGRPGARAFRASVGKVATSAEFFHVVEHYFPREDSPSPGRSGRGAGEGEGKDSVQFFNLTLDSLLERLILPERDRSIFLKMAKEKLGMKATTERIADHLLLESLRGNATLGHAKGDRTEQAAVHIVEIHRSTARCPDGVASLIGELLGYKTALTEGKCARQRARGGARPISSSVAITTSWADDSFMGQPTVLASAVHKAADALPGSSRPKLPSFRILRTAILNQRQPTIVNRGYARWSSSAMPAEVS